MKIIVGDEIHEIAESTISKTDEGIRIQPRAGVSIKIELTDPAEGYDLICKGIGNTEPIDLTRLLPTTEEPEAPPEEPAEDVGGEGTPDNTAADTNGKETA